jgi:hypothetical protein
MSRCDHCPVTGELPCRAGNFCAWAGVAEPDPVHLRHIIDVALQDAGRPLPVQAAVSCNEPVVLTTPIPLAGDIVEAVAKRIGAARLAKWIEKHVGVDCGCAGRRDALNRLSEKLLKWANLRS